MFYTEGVGKNDGKSNERKRRGAKGSKALRL